MNNPDCEHFWIDMGEDAEGKGQASCRDCPMGRYYVKGKFEVVDGHIRSNSI